jgi:hypothetical protein
LRQRGGVRLRCHDTFDGEASGPCLRISKQFRKGDSAKLIFGGALVYILYCGGPDSSRP